MIPVRIKTIDGCVYEAAPEKEGCGCEGCAFAYENVISSLLSEEDKKAEALKCPESQRYHDCCENRVIWIKLDSSTTKKEPALDDKKQNPDIGRKYDNGKPMYNLLPADALEEVVKVLTYGAIKYNEPIDQENWRLVKNPQPRYFSASQRHLWADHRGEEIDSESGLYHLAHAISGLLFKLQLKIEEKKSVNLDSNQAK